MTIGYHTWKKRTFNQRPYSALRQARYKPQYGGNVYDQTVTSGTAQDSQDTWSTDTFFRILKRLENRRMITQNNLDVGSAFTTIKRTYWDNSKEQPAGVADREWISQIYSYRGPQWVVEPGRPSAWPPFSEASMTLDMQKLGATAIARTIPTNPIVGAGAAIGESMERLPALPGMALLGKAGNVSKKFADEYLNLEFGVKPLISDIRATAKAANESAKIREQLKRDSGRLVRRRYEFPIVETVVNQSGTGFYSWPGMDTLMYSQTGTWSSTRTTTKKTWFSGAYTYYYNEGSNLSDRMARTEQHLNKMLGLRLTPSLIWELSPWSWLADWKTNAGDVISNISALSRDGLLLRWGYVMQELTITDSYYANVYPWNGGVIRPEQHFQTRVKKRIQATPYGFGLDPDWRDFSPRQLAILGALGITRGR